MICPQVVVASAQVGNKTSTGLPQTGKIGETGVTGVAQVKRGE